MLNDTKTKSGRYLGGNVLMILAGATVLLSEAMKFLHVPAVVQEMAASGFPGGKLLLVATLGSTSAALFSYPRSRSIGLLLLSSFLGGAISTHIQQGKYQLLAAPLMVLAFAWWGAYLRHPEMLWSMARPAAHETAQPSWASPEAQ